MGEVQTYDLELLGQTYQVRSADEETVVSAVFERLLAEVAAAGENQPDYLRQPRTGGSGRMGRRSLHGALEHV